MKVQVCTWKSCWPRFSKYIVTRLKNDKKFYGWKDVEIEETLCMGECKKGPNIKIDSEKHNYVQWVKASELVNNKLSGKKETTKKFKKKK